MKESPNKNEETNSFPYGETIAHDERYVQKAK